MQRSGATWRLGGRLADHRRPVEAGGSSRNAFHRQTAVEKTNRSPHSAIIGLPPEKGEVLGMKTGESRLCVPGDKSPAGTVKDGYRKTVVPGPFIEMCQWEPIK